ncbi:MAG TPA: patatin-like phospholipase family protein, partial [Nevskiaceae bacterium]|nr:patatin-like phospholipase family protein [Nevskiaceae bacterium]
RLRLVRARGLPTLTELEADPLRGTAIARELLNSAGVSWTLRLGADWVDAPRVLRALHLLDQHCDQLMVFVHARDAQALLAGAQNYFWRGVWLTRDGAKPPPFAFTNAAVEAERGHRTRILLAAGERPVKVGAMRALDARVGGKAFVAGGEMTDVRGTQALARDLAGQRIGLALGAGASRGFAHIGVLERLKTLGLPIDVIVGCSAGSGIGASWSFGFEPDHLARVFSELQKHAARWTLPSRSLMSGRALGQHIANVAAGCGFDDARWPVGVVAVDLYAAREELFTEGSIIDCIRASSAIPGIYPPVKIGDKWYVDGGVLNPLPSAFVRPVGADVVIAVDLAGGTPPELAAKAPLRGPSLLQVLRQSANLMHARITHHAREAADLIIRPLSEGPPPAVTDYVGAQVWRRYGREAVERTLPEFEALLPWFRSRR